MNVLEDAGLIFQPHTSAGRVPSDEGYRYYIEHLMEPGALSPSEVFTILHQFHQVEAWSEQWLKLVMALLANYVGGASVATPPLVHQARVRQISVTPLSDRHAVLTVVLNSGKMSQQLLAVEAGYEGRDLVGMGRWLGESLANHTAAQCNDWARSAHGVESAVARAVATDMERADQESIHGLYYEGIRHMAAQPEFSTGEQLKPVLEVLELRRALGQWLRQVSSRGGVQYVIGREFPIEEIRHCSVVLSGYGDPREPMGVVGVLGPTRMPYWRAAPMVEYMASLMGRLVAEAYL